MPLTIIAAVLKVISDHRDTLINLTFMLLLRLFPEYTIEHIIFYMLLNGSGLVLDIFTPHDPAPVIFDPILLLNPPPQLRVWIVRGVNAPPEVYLEAVLWLQHKPSATVESTARKVRRYA